MHRLSVGELYHPGKTKWPETAQYNYRGGAHELLILMASPKPEEVESVRSGRADFGLLLKPPVMLLLYKFAPRVPWSDAPFSVHLVPEVERQLPPDPVGEERATVQTILVDANTGIVQALRLLSLTPAFTAGLHRAIRAQAQIPWVARSFDSTLQQLYTASSKELAEQADLRCRGGESV